jgi:hypothetical protein
MRRWSPWLLALVAVLTRAAEPQPSQQKLISYREPVVTKLEVDASAVVAFTIRANGRVADAVTLATTNRVLGDSARDAVLEWRFERDPTFGTGRNAVPSKVLHREVIEFVFKRGGIVTSMSHRDSAKAWFPRDYEPVIRLVQADALDPPLARLERTPGPTAAQIVPDLTAGGSVLVSFVVDETGAVRVPIAEQATDDRLVDAAIELIGGWRYEPPTDDGQPVLVETRASVSFGPRGD